MTRKNLLVPSLMMAATLLYSLAVVFLGATAAEVVGIGYIIVIITSAAATRLTRL